MLNFQTFSIERVKVPEALPTIDLFVYWCITKVYRRFYNFDIPVIDLD